MTSDANLLLRAVPDIPRFVEARSLLLNRRGDIFCASNDFENFLILDRADRLLVLVGQPSESLLWQVLADSPETIEILTTPENRDYATKLLPGWELSPAVIHVLREDVRQTDSSNRDVRFAAEKQLRKLQPIEPELAEELLSANAYARVAATFWQGEPVSFCYPGHETETLWDVSIDTLPGFRRRGFASACALFMIDVMARRGKRPVWGAETSNIGSLKLARKLGFTPVDELLLYSHPG